MWNLKTQIHKNREYNGGYYGLRSREIGEILLNCVHVKLVYIEKVLEI